MNLIERKFTLADIEEDDQVYMPCAIFTEKEYWYTVTLKTDAHIVIRNGFPFVLDENDMHRITGLLKKNITFEALMKNYGVEIEHEPLLQKGSETKRDRKLRILQVCGLWASVFCLG